MDKAVENAKLDAVPGRRRPTLHDLRDTFASLLIARHADTARAAFEASYGTILERSGLATCPPPVPVAKVKRLS